MPQKTYGSGANAVPMGKLHPILAAKRQDGSSVAQPPVQRPPMPMMAPLNYGPHPPPPMLNNVPPQFQRPPLPPPLFQDNVNNGSQKRPSSSDIHLSIGISASQGDKKKRKRSRWASEETKMIIPGMPTAIPSGLTEEQRITYITHLRIEEISRRLRSGDLGIPDNPEDRSPSPEPIYNSDGKRLNTRDFRVRKKLEEERHSLVQDAVKANAEYKPPADYKPPATRIQEKVLIPQDEHPHVNFIGLLIGPRGNTLKKTEKDTSCKIMIRGKGSIKDGKGRRDGQPIAGEDEILHALVTGQSHESVKKCVDLIKVIIKQGVDAPEGQNDLKRMQLRELAALNGTLRDDEIARCRNCGSSEHKHWECPEQQNFTAALTCSNCGSSGHIAMDCTQETVSNVVVPSTPQDTAKMDSEYMSLMAELGEGPVGPPQRPPPQNIPKPQPLPSSPASLMGNPAPMKVPPGKPGGGPPGPKFGGGGPPHQQGGMPPWNSASAPKPLMSSPVPPPANLSNRAPSHPSGNHQPWNKTNSPAGMPPFGMQGGAPHAMSGHQRPQVQQGPAPPPPPPPGQGPGVPPWQTQSHPWQGGMASPFGFSPPAFSAYQNPPPPPPPPPSSNDSPAPPWAQAMMGGAPPPPPPPPPQN